MLSEFDDYPALQDYIDSLCLIPTGTFQMGSSTGDSDEKPVHSVTLSAFRMGATPVTFSIWLEYCTATGTELPEWPYWESIYVESARTYPPVHEPWDLISDQPVVNVSWNDIMGTDGKGGFCAWASDVAGFRLTLPTEAQFEYASRGGQSGLDYPWGNSFDRSKLWCWGNSEYEFGETALVTRSYNIFRNAYGLTDMSGNVWQWCSDLYGPYSSSSQNDPTGPSLTSDNKRCVRGGSWLGSGPDYFRCAIRGRGIPDDGYDNIGFRLSAGPG
jgi:formylglycine-generating enzyme required for sulfatase activity